MFQTVDIKCRYYKLGELSEGHVDFQRVVCFLKGDYDE